MKIPTHEDVLQTRERAAAVKGSIAALLPDRSRYNEIIDMLSEPANEELSLHDQDIYILRIIAQTVKLELESNTRYVLFDGRSINDLVTLFRTLSLYLRRIEFDFPPELQKEILDYILKEKLSVIAIVSVIQNNMSIINKDKVTEGIKSLLEKMV